jgi:hypothetical protein
MCRMYSCARVQLSACERRFIAAANEGLCVHTHTHQLVNEAGDHTSLGHVHGGQDARLTSPPCCCRQQGGARHNTTSTPPLRRPVQCCVTARPVRKHQPPKTLMLGASCRPPSAHEPAHRALGRRASSAARVQPANRPAAGSGGSGRRGARRGLNHTLPAHPCPLARSHTHTTGQQPPRCTPPLPGQRGSSAAPPWAGCASLHQQRRRDAARALGRSGVPPHQLEPPPPPPRCACCRAATAPAGTALPPSTMHPCETRGRLLLGRRRHQPRHARGLLPNGHIHTHAST